MIYSGSAIQVSRIDNDIAHLEFDLADDSVNKFSRQVTRELGAALSAIEGLSNLNGLLISSRKEVFIVGADITEFGAVFTAGPDEITGLISENNKNFNRIEGLSIPSVVAINGYAMGGGLELCLACDYRIMSSSAKIGLPESKLGLLPGWGGTVRLPRMVGVDTAIEWIASGAEQSASVALQCQVVDGVVAPEKLLDSAIRVLGDLISGKLDYRQRRQRKSGPIPINDIEGLLAFESAKMFVGGKAGKHYPAPVRAIKVMQDGAKLARDEAQELETQAFAELAQGPVAKNLVSIFLNDQWLMKKAKKLAKASPSSVSNAAVLGAGIMGGGIAYQSAYRGIPIQMKDIAQAGLDAGLAEAQKLLTKRVERGKLSVDAMAAVLNRIGATLHYETIRDADIVVEAVVENPKVKKAVLAEVEALLGDEAVMCSNTSTISIDELAEPLKRPEKFCGLHFFNPVHAMPLVEVIRGKQTTEETLAKVTSYALALGKKPVVVNNCPGFLVNRVLFPYFAGFSMLIRDGADFQKVDKFMERWGWPMGPAYLLDVVGIDTSVHAQGVMSAGFPDRMTKDFDTAADLLFAAQRLGQKTGKGFYNYSEDKRGKPIKEFTEDSVEILRPHVAQSVDFSEQDVVARMMIPMATELARCLEEGIVASPAEADMALVYGVGFPPFRGGVFQWLDEMGIGEFIGMCQRFEGLGPLYKPTSGMLEMHANNQTYYGAVGGQ